MLLSRYLPSNLSNNISFIEINKPEIKRNCLNFFFSNLASYLKYQPIYFSLCSTLWFYTALEKKVLIGNSIHKFKKCWKIWLRHKVFSFRFRLSMRKMNSVDLSLALHNGQPDAERTISAMMKMNELKRLGTFRVYALAAAQGQRVIVRFKRTIRVCAQQGLINSAVERYSVNTWLKCSYSEGFGKHKKHILPAK